MVNWSLIKYIVGRLIQTVITLLIILTVTFIIFEMLPATPIDLLSQNPLIKPSQKEYMIELFGFDKSPWERYLIYMRNMLTFDFGISYTEGGNVNDLLSERIPRTLFLFGLSVVV